VRHCQEFLSRSHAWCAIVAMLPWPCMAWPDTPAWGTFLVLHREDASELPVAHCSPRINDVRQQVSSNIETARRPEAVDLAIGQLANAS
jgi:hypothetical protein